MWVLLHLDSIRKATYELLGCLPMEPLTWPVGTFSNPCAPPIHTLTRGQAVVHAVRCAHDGGKSELLQVLVGAAERLLGLWAWRLQMSV